MPTPHPSLERDAKRNAVDREKENLVAAFRRVFGSDAASRTPDQKIVWAVLQRRLETPVFTADAQGRIDTILAGLNEGQRMFARQLMELAQTPLAARPEKPTVTK